MSISAQEAALTSAYHQHFEDIRGFIRTRAKPEDVNDLVQDVFLTAWRLRHRLHHPSGVRQWLFAIAHYVVLNAYRKARRTLIVSPERLALTANNHANAWDVLDDLSAQVRPRTKRVLFSRYAAQLSTRELASLLRISEPAARKRLQRARTELRGFLKTGA